MVLAIGLPPVEGRAFSKVVQVRGPVSLSSVASPEKASGMTMGRFNAMTKERKKMDYTEHEEKKNDEQVQARLLTSLSCPLRQMSHCTYSPGSSDRQIVLTERRDLQNSKRQLATSSQENRTDRVATRPVIKNGAGCLVTQNGADQASVTILG